MIVLVIQIVLISFLGLICNHLGGTKERNNYVLLFFAFCSMWFVHTMVVIKSVPDLEGYQEWFEMARNQSITWLMEARLVKGLEIGYVVFNKIIATLILDFRVFLGIYNVILIGLYLLFIKRFSPFVLLSILLLLLGDYNMSFYVLRQHIAMALFVASLPFVLEKRLVPYLLVCALAFSFHQTALICLPVIFLYSIKSKKLLISILLGALITGGSYITMFYNSELEMLNVYASQLDSTYEGTNNTPLVIALIYFVVYICALRSKVFEEGENKLFFILLSLNVILCATGIGFAPTVRLALYFSLTSIVTLPLSLSYIKNPPTRYSLLLLVFGMELYKFIYGTGSDIREGIRFIFE